jgi:hypothetical protein
MCKICISKGCSKSPQSISPESTQFGRYYLKTNHFVRSSQINAFFEASTENDLGRAIWLFNEFCLPVKNGPIFPCTSNERLS